MKILKPIHKFYRIGFFVLFTIQACSSVQDKTINQNLSQSEISAPKPSTTNANLSIQQQLCKNSSEKESFEVQKLNKHVAIHYGKRFAIADPSDEGYPCECGLKTFIEIYWKLDDQTLIESIVENQTYSTEHIQDKSSNYQFDDAKLLGSELVVFLKIGYLEKNIPYRFKLNRKLKKIIRLTASE